MQCPWWGNHPCWVAGWWDGGVTMMGWGLLTCLVGTDTLFRSCRLLSATQTQQWLRGEVFIPNTGVSLFIAEGFWTLPAGTWFMLGMLCSPQGSPLCSQPCPSSGCNSLLQHWAPGVNHIWCKNVFSLLQNTASLSPSHSLFFEPLSACPKALHFLRSSGSSVCPWLQSHAIPNKAKKATGLLQLLFLFL